mgnify:CR=1 FL=1
MTTTDKIAEIEKKIEAARREQAREEARRDAAKADLKTLLRRAQEEFGATSIKDLEAVSARLKREEEQALAALEEKVSAL